MNPNLPLNGPAASGAPSGATGPGASKSADNAGPAFQALLEKLEAHTQDLRSASESLDDPGALAGAVDRSRASIEDALSLHDQLLEAYRAAHLNPDPTDEAA